MESYERFGLAQHYRYLDAEQTAEHVQIDGVLGSIFNAQCASVHPGRLARGLARVVERLGATIYEQTEVIDYTEGSSPRLITERGDVRAKVLVLAGEAYLTGLPKLKRQLIPPYSLIVLTEPIPASLWAEIGWQNRELVGSGRLSVDYLQHTADGRIAFGGRGAPYHLGSKISDEFDRHEPTHAMLRELTISWFPMLKDIRFTHAWGGPLGMPRDWMPTMSYDESSGIASARGYTGQGVATANLSGRVLTDLITGRRTDITALPVVNHRSPDWEPEPLRWLGIRYVQRGFLRLDDEAEQTGRPPSGRTLAERLGRH
jgi:glycine/D-amino acid oxidase-like deaminating enzyme